MEPLYILISYLVGSIPFSYIIPKLLRGVNVMEVGDGNIGAMNVYYVTKSTSIGILCLILDIAKALIPTVIFGPFYGVFAIVGHQFSVVVWVLTRFRRIVSGFGAASTIGYFIVVYPLAILIALLITILLVILLNPYSIKEVGKWVEKEQANIEAIIAILLTIIILYCLNIEVICEIGPILAISFTLAYIRGIRRMFRKWSNL